MLKGSRLTGDRVLLLLLIATSPLTLEPVAFRVMNTVFAALHLNLDAGFWSMGLAGAVSTLSAIVISYLLLRSTFLKRFIYRDYVIPTAVFTGLLLLQCHRRDFAIPFWDDYYAYYEWYIHLKSLPGAVSRIALVFESYLECKTAVPRSISLVFHRLFSEDFLLPMKYMNVLVLVGIAGLMTIDIVPRERRRFAFWTAALLLLNLQQFYNLLCAFSGTAYYLVVFFALLAIRLQQKEGMKYAWLTALSACAAAFTFGNGWLVFPMLLLLYIHDRKWKETGLLLLVGSIAAWFYFHDYSPERLNPIDRFRPAVYMAYSLCFIGSHFQFNGFLFLPFLMSGFVMITGIYIFKKRKLEKTTRTNLMLLSFICGSAFFAGIFRHQWGVHQALSLRYGFFSVVAAAAACVLLLQIVNDRPKLKLSIVLLSAAGVITVAKAFFFYPEMAIAQTENHRMIRNWLLCGTSIEERTAFYPLGTTRMLESSEPLGIWKRSPEDTVRVNSGLFTIRYLAPVSDQAEP